MSRAQAPIPSRGASLECHGIRGIDGPNLIAQLAPLNARFSSLHPLLDRKDLSEGDRLRIELEVFILKELMGYDGTSMEECGAAMTAAYKRPFSEWLTIIMNAHCKFDTAALQQQLANAWREIEALLTKHPR